MVFGLPCYAIEFFDGLINIDIFFGVIWGIYFIIIFFAFTYPFKKWFHFWVTQGGFQMHFCYSILETEDGSLFQVINKFWNCSKWYCQFFLSMQWFCSEMLKGFLVARGVLLEGVPTFSAIKISLSILSNNNTA